MAAPLRKHHDIHESGNAMREVEVAREAARVGGAVLARHFRAGVAVRAKQDAAHPGDLSNLVCDADVESEREIVRLLNERFPGHAVLGEEGHAADVNAEHLWIIDPLDGTTNFAHRIPHFAVSVAYYRSGAPVCGVIYNPARDDWYEAVRGGGAWANGARVHVAEHTRLDETLIGVGFYYDRGAMMEATLAAIRDLFRCNIHGVRRFGTASLDLCSVGAGLYGAFFEYQLSPWDFAAGRLFVEEAGGRVTTCAGDPLPLSRGSVLASNGRLHDAVLDIVRRHLLPP
jgi:myo-inositol-1(or 4)-monophosphatase